MIKTLLHEKSQKKLIKLSSKESTSINHDLFRKVSKELGKIFNMKNKSLKPDSNSFGGINKSFIDQLINGTLTIPSVGPCHIAPFSITSSQSQDLVSKDMIKNNNNNILPFILVTSKEKQKHKALGSDKGIVVFFAVPFEEKLDTVTDDLKKLHTFLFGENNMYSGQYDHIPFLYVAFEDIPDLKALLLTGKKDISKIYNYQIKMRFESKNYSLFNVFKDVINESNIILEDNSNVQNPNSSTHPFKKAVEATKQFIKSKKHKFSAFKDVTDIDESSFQKLLNDINVNIDLKKTIFPGRDNYIDYEEKYFKLLDKKQRAKFLNDKNRIESLIYDKNEKLKQKLELKFDNVANIQVLTENLQKANGNLMWYFCFKYKLDLDSVKLFFERDLNYFFQKAYDFFMVNIDIGTDNVFALNLENNRTIPDTTFRSTVQDTVDLDPDLETAVGDIEDDEATSDTTFRSTVQDTVDLDPDLETAVDVIEDDEATSDTISRSTAQDTVDQDVDPETGVDVIEDDSQEDTKKVNAINVIKPLLKNNITGRPTKRDIDYAKIKESIENNVDVGEAILGKLFEAKIFKSNRAIKNQAKEIQKHAAQALHYLIVFNLINIIQEEKGELGLNESWDKLKSALLKGQKLFSTVGSVGGLGAKKPMQDFFNNQIVNKISSGMGIASIGTFLLSLTSLGAPMLALFPWTSTLFASYAGFNFIKRCSNNFARTGAIAAENPTTLLREITSDRNFNNVIFQGVEAIFDNYMQSNSGTIDLKDPLKNLIRSGGLNEEIFNKIDKQKEKLNNSNISENNLKDFKDQYFHVYEELKEYSPVVRMIGVRNSKLLLNEVFLNLIDKEDYSFDDKIIKKAISKAVISHDDVITPLLHNKITSIIADKIKIAEDQIEDQGGSKFAKIYKSDVFKLLGRNNQKKDLLTFAKQILDQVSFELTGKNFNTYQKLYYKDITELNTESFLVKCALLNKSMLPLISESDLYENEDLDVESDDYEDADDTLEMTEDELTRIILQRHRSESLQNVGALAGLLGYLSAKFYTGNEQTQSSQQTLQQVQTQSQQTLSVRQELAKGQLRAAETSFEDAKPHLEEGYDLKGRIIEVISPEGKHIANIEISWSNVSLTNPARSITGTWTKIGSDGQPSEALFIGRGAQIKQYVGDVLERCGIDSDKLSKGEMTDIIKSGSKSNDITDTTDGIDTVIFNFDNLQGSVGGYDLGDLFAQIDQNAENASQPEYEPDSLEADTPLVIDEAYQDQFDEMYEKTNKLLEDFKNSDTFKNMDSEKQQEIVDIFKAKQHVSFKKVNPEFEQEISNNYSFDKNEEAFVKLSDAITNKNTLGMKLDSTTTPKATTGQNFDFKAPETPKAPEEIQEIPWKNILANPKLLVMLCSKIFDYGQKKYEPREIYNMFYSVFDPARVIMMHLYCALRYETVEDVMRQYMPDFVDSDTQLGLDGSQDSDPQRLNAGFTRKVDPSLQDVLKETKKLINMWDDHWKGN